MKKNILIISLLITGNLCFSQLFENPKNFTTVQLSYALGGQSSREDIRTSPPIDEDFWKTRVYSVQAFQHRYLIGRYFAVGLGGVFTYQTDPNLGYAQILLDMRGFLSDEENTVYPFIRGGTAISTNLDYNKSIILGLGIGYRFHLFDKLWSVDLSRDARQFWLKDDVGTFTGTLSLSLGIQL